MPNNQAILLTAPGVAAIAVIRIIGPAVAPFLSKHFSRPAKLNRCVHGQLTDGPRIIDDPVIVLISPEAADINIHASPWIIRSVLDLAKSNGFTIVDYTLESAALDVPGSPNILWQEVLLALPLAKTKETVQILLAQPAAWENLLTKIESKTISPKELEIIQTDRSLHWMLSLPRVAIIGPPNVGKSTLANRLFGQDRSITADLPGTTRDWVGEIANIDGLAITLIDTAGRRKTTDKIESAAITAGAAKAATADLILIVLDQSTPLTPDSQELLAAHPDAIRIANKSDRPAAWNPAELNAIPTVATTNTGLDELRRQIREHFDCDDIDIDRPRCWTDRQRELINTAMIQ